MSVPINIIGTEAAEKVRRLDKLKIFAEILQSLGEPEICKHFGCGRMLTLQEKRFGDKCIHHQNHNKSDPWKNHCLPKT